ncbi:quinone oxidoreductase [Methyloversatilis sp.]|uniref:quinone oxidoreductase family protein n=1 Tax=Methyloversatilis sp. TaxID=2569862 RepID=UPI0027346BAE|nr:quinone oxidoreductase [Methyloversatilis sp.]MDP2870091.1 quinone oxidoreductase [Methyloversatilis sp.]MDP3289405.1 quinone oxidoreductase [Methyloversatilis sp.]MDP3456765.1 quinone oxidoreductase [Methyloversatilis sp.]MDP3580020.1 quinone oxidoreductase [Methyloversatilis sp.]
MTDFAVRMHRTGGPEVLQYDAVELSDPAAGEARVRQHAIGVNFIDIYYRSGLYPMPLPGGLGLEAAGVVEAVGDGVTDIAPGDRVAYAGGPPGAYAQVRNLPADRLVGLPDAIDFDTAAALMLKGLTAQYLLRRTCRIEPGDTVLLHAAAGGVGLIASQWAQALGATVIGTVSTPAKAELARAHGCAHVLTGVAPADLPVQVRALTGGKGVRVVYDGIGRDTFMASLDCLAPLGMMVSFGNASGPVAAFEPALLAQKGSLFLTRPTLFHYVAQRADLLAAADELFARAADGTLRVAIGQRHALKDCARAHEALAARLTTGSLLLTPE